MRKIMLTIATNICLVGYSWCQVSEEVAEEIYGAIEIRATLEYFQVKPWNYVWVETFRSSIQPFIDEKRSAIRISERPFDSIKVNCQTEEDDEYIRFYKYWIFPKTDTATGGRWIFPGSLTLKGFERGIIGVKCDGQVDLVSGYFFTPRLYYLNFGYWEKYHEGSLEELIGIYFHHLKPSEIEVCGDSIEFDSGLTGDHYIYEVLDGEVII